MVREQAHDDEIYKNAADLANLLRSSQEYNDYLKAKEALENDELHMELFLKMREQLLRFQLAEVMNDEDIKEKENVFNDTYFALSDNQLISNFLNAEYRLQRMMQKIQKIFGEVLNFDDEEPDLETNSKLH